MKATILLTSIISLSAAVINSVSNDHQLNRRLFFGGGYGGDPYGGQSPYNGFASAYRPRPLMSLNLRDLSILSPKQKDTQINIDEGMYNSQGYNPFALAPWGNGPPPSQAPPY